MLNLNEFIAIFEQSSTMLHYLNKESGEIVETNVESLNCLKNKKNIDETKLLSEEQSAFINGAKDILGKNKAHYLKLPDVESFDEFRAMKEFCNSLEDESVREALLFTIQGKGSFSRFRKGVHFHHLEMLWKKFRHQRVKQFAMQWCKQNNILYNYERPE